MRRNLLALLMAGAALLAVEPNAQAQCAGPCEGGWIWSGDCVCYPCPDWASYCASSYDPVCPDVADWCGSPPDPTYCGDAACNGGESCASCPADCGACPPPPPVCGDGACSGEDCTTCAADCGNCAPPSAWPPGDFRLEIWAHNAAFGVGFLSWIPFGHLVGVITRDGVPIAVFSMGGNPLSQSNVPPVLTPPPGNQPIDYGNPYSLVGSYAVSQGAADAFYYGYEGSLGCSYMGGDSNMAMRRALDAAGIDFMSLSVPGDIWLGYVGFLNDGVFPLEATCDTRLELGNSYLATVAWTEWTTCFCAPTWLDWYNYLRGWPDPLCLASLATALFGVNPYCSIGGGGGGGDVCGDGSVGGSEQCETDADCGSGESCDACACVVAEDPPCYGDPECECWWYYSGFWYDGVCYTCESACDYCWGYGCWGEGYSSPGCQEGHWVVCSDIEYQCGCFGAG